MDDVDAKDKLKKTNSNYSYSSLFSKFNPPLYAIPDKLLEGKR